MNKPSWKPKKTWNLRPTTILKKWVCNWYTYTVFEAPLPRISLYWKKNQTEKTKWREKVKWEMKREREGIHTLPYLPVGSSSTKSESSSSKCVTPFILYFTLMLTLLFFDFSYDLRFMCCCAPSSFVTTYTNRNWKRGTGRKEQYFILLFSQPFKRIFLIYLRKNIKFI